MISTNSHPASSTPLTFDQISAELHARDRTIAQAIRKQMDSGDEAAKALIDDYGTAVTTSDVTAREAVLLRYNHWRSANEVIVAPIAAELGLPPPQPMDAPGALFGGDVPPPAVTPPVVASGSNTTAGAPPPPAPLHVPAAAGPAEGKRRPWTQAEIADLTRRLVTAKDGQLDRALAEFAMATRGKWGSDDARAKAIELELLAAPPAAVTAPIALTVEDDIQIRSMFAPLVNPALSTELNRLRVKHAGVVLREIVKQFE